MSPSDEIELHRLSDMLTVIDGLLPSDSPLREGLAKSGLALASEFIRGGRANIEQDYDHIGKPLSAEQQVYLTCLGIDPET